MRLMKIEAVFIVLTLLALPLFASGAKVERFQNGNAEAVADLSGPGFSAVVNITMPAECYVLNATVNVTGEEAQGVYPVGPRVELNGTVLWEFNGTGYGALGRQDLFSDGKTQVRVPFGVGGGTNSANIRLPKGALVRSATMEVNVTGPMAGMAELVNFTGAFSQGLFGYKVSNAGDVNNDGYDDVIVGAHGTTNFTGCAHIYFGGPVMNNTLNITLTGAAEGDGFGYSVSNTGDVNNDGYSDVIVGAYKNDSGGTDAGRAYIYYGGSAMDNTADVTLTGAAPNDWFGCSVSSAGDVNNDGYEDVIVGAGRSMNDIGRACLYLGGPAMDSNPDMIFFGTAASDNFGFSVSEAKDVNRDGYDDIIIGAYDSSGNSPGHAYIYFGGPAMDSAPDVTFTGNAAGVHFGFPVSNAGDVDNDGYDDVVVSAGSDNTGGLHAGRVSIYFGGPVMDNIADVVLIGAGANDYFGSCGSTSGDMNYDGYDDVIVGAGVNDAGRVHIYYGGSAMDDIPDVILTSASANDNFGWSVSSASDVTGDGNNDVIVGAYNGGGNHAGRVYVFSSLRGILNPDITIGSRSIWNRTDYFTGINRPSDFSDALDEYFRFASPSGNDSFGNFFVDVPINISAESEGNIILFNLSVVYQYDANVPDFSAPLNKYRSAHKGEKDASGNLTIPVIMRSSTGGELKLAGLNITYDGAPILVSSIPNIEMDEDSINNSLLDLFDYFQDEFDTQNTLVFNVEDATHSDLVIVRIFGGHYLSADALTGAANDNWTGVVSLRIHCKDSHGSSVISNLFNITIRNVNDPPIITSKPVDSATVSQEYVYQITAVDGDNDPLIFLLQKGPVSMMVSAGGRMTWVPAQIGNFNISVSVGDGQATAIQDFSVNVTANHPPIFMSNPVTTATVNVPYLYNLSAVDDDGDALSFSLVTKPDGMSIGPSTGSIMWMPGLSQAGNHTVTVKVIDGRGGDSEQTFNITVRSNARPKCVITSPANGALVSGNVAIRGTAENGDAAITIVQVRADGGKWHDAKGIESWSCIINTIGLKKGSHVFEARAFDGSNYSDSSSVTLVVDNPQPYISSGNDLWWILPSVILVIVASVGVLFWKAGTRKTPK